MTTVIYLHGFASTGVSPKSDKLIKEFGANSVLRPDLPIDPDKTVEVVTSLVHKVSDHPVIFVGTSLGGFWANYFAHKFDAPCVLVNPSINPDITMAARVGTEIHNYKTGDLIVITDEIVEQFKKYKKEAETLYNGALVNVFLAEDDELLDSKKTFEHLKYFNSCTVTQDGGHRYDMHWDLVVAHIKHLLDATNDTPK